MGVSNVKCPLTTGLIDTMVGEKPFLGIFADTHIPAIRRTPIPIIEDKRQYIRDYLVLGFGRFTPSFLINSARRRDASWSLQLVFAFLFSKSSRTPASNGWRRIPAIKMLSNFIEQSIGVVWLSHKRNASSFGTESLLSRRYQRRQEDDWYLSRFTVTFQDVGDVAAVQAGHHDIKNNDKRKMLFGQIHGLCSAGGCNDLVAGL